MASFAAENPPSVYPPILKQGDSKEHELKRWEEYRNEYDRSIQDPTKFWTSMSEKYLSWFSPFNRVLEGSFEEGDVRWFANGKINACYNCVDRHLPHRADQTAIIWEADEIGAHKHITYREIYQEVCRIANVMKMHGVRKGDVVTIYMPMIPEVAMTMLACARLGAIHSIVFAGFSADSLRDRVRDCNSRFVFIADEGKRGGKSLPLRAIAEAAIVQCPNVSHLFTFRTTDPSLELPAPASPAWEEVWMHEWLPRARPVCPCEWMDAEDDFFILYTSGSTGKPKGVAHTTGGYLLFAAMTIQKSFDLREKDIFCCVADCGWITGHTYIVYGPLLNGSTTVMFESVPTYPHPYRYWDLVQTHKVTQFYTAPTAIRALTRFDTAPIADYDLSSLRVLGTVGEPINPEAWKWYYNHVGRGRCSVVDTYWQTETGGHIATNFPGVTPMKPGSCAFPYLGVEFAIVDPMSGQELQGNDVEGVLCIKKPWPAIARTVYGDHDRYRSVYTRPYAGYYFTGDGARRDADGYYFITGRVDDVINPSGHRIGTAEVESALVACSEVAEAAVVGFPHEIKGEGIGCYVILRQGVVPDAALTTKLKNAVRAAIGPIATPDFIIYSDLPKTRSGKIMRRILRKIAAGEEDSIGDITTLADPTVVDALIAKFKALH